MSNLSQFIAALPKAELHLHIEGSFEPELMFNIAERNGITLPYDSVDALKKAYEFNNLQEFLDIYYQGMNVLQTEQDYYDLTMAYLQRVKTDNVRHVEIFWDPQGHLERNVPFSTQINGILKALEEGEQSLDISYRLIMSFLRHLSEESAFETLVQAEPYLEQIYGVGLDSSEVGHPPEKFARVFAACKDKGLKITAHAGEEGPPEYVWEALSLLKIDRIDHGNAAARDDELIDHLIETGMTLTMCPLSNQRLCVTPDLTENPLAHLLRSGVRVTVNSDDPSYFGGYVNDNYVAIADALDLSMPEIVMLARNSFIGSFLSDVDKEAALDQIDAVCEQHRH